VALGLDLVNHQIPGPFDQHIDAMIWINRLNYSKFFEGAAQWASSYSIHEGGSRKLYIACGLID